MNGESRIKTLPVIIFTARYSNKLLLRYFILVIPDFLDVVFLSAYHIYVYVSSYIVSL